MAGDAATQTFTILAEFTMAIIHDPKNVLVTVTLACVTTMKQWPHKDHLLRGVPLRVLPVKRELVKTDASLHGWGAVFETPEIEGYVAQHATAHQHSQDEGSMASAATFQHQLKDKHVLIRTDNTTVVFYIIHQGGTRSQSLLKLEQRLWK